MDVAPDGGYIIGGEFRKVFVTPRANLAKITAAGALVTSFDPSAIMSGANNTTGIGIVEVHKGQQ